MGDNIWIFVVLGLAIILAVIAYNMYRENQERQRVRAQFSHSDKDVLLDSKTESARDGRVLGKQGQPQKERREADLSQFQPTMAKPKVAPINVPKTAAVEAENSNAPERDLFVMPSATPAERTEEVAETVLQSDEQVQTQHFQFETVQVPTPSQAKVAKDGLLLDLDAMAKQELGWFDPRFDYLAFISLREPMELHSLPRLSKRRFQIVGCTMDNRWQLAEPIPSVYYQGFVVGVQAISRMGLITAQELEAFGEQANAFAQKLNAGLRLTDIDSFLDVARPLDDVCARVDHAIAIHLVSQSSVSGTELRRAVEEVGFVLSEDGAFHFENEQGDTMFSIVNIDKSVFTPSLLDNKAYRGFSVLLDIPRVPNGAKSFDHFMHLVIGLATELRLDLVNDKLEELSTTWLKNVGTYVVERQAEMKKIGIEPGGELAKRLFL
ncbi:MAG: cell division protein ZipA C-terminal FtsZ-binding domain-containing protein [Neisseria sp.]|nr:cell division protein ZipA C-terminal FtsZ-binding domain-containing protein [Neisseria sp.]